ncbi:D-arabinono-1,4-lactone oxidase [Rhizobium sp. L1K21]|uniref:D-arabinono-1,4-lactone oxidase n=1 Tax=Rhizobium sp. L1K21 TaxID=2954933 RepID=UPI002091F347|nr:D-arabinono-1,4-lactone oxidase [Rhizobium sp. L1K21]MCO6187057.1 FAD-binding protein [Rhizobium sp. L1K21]
MSLSWSNWSGSVQSSPKAIEAPSTIEALSAVIRSAPGPVRIAGSGHSFTPLVESAGTILDLSAFSGLHGHDTEALTATVGAGTKLADLTHLLQSVGQALPNMGDIDKQALGGALGTATHGTGPELGAYHTQLRAITLVDGRGEVRRYSDDTDSEMIRATGVTLGAFGALTEVTISNAPSYRLHKRRWSMPIGDMLADFDAFYAAYRSAEFYFIPFSGHALCLASDTTDAPVSTRPPEVDEDGIATLRMARNFTSRLPWLRRKLIGNALRKLPDEDYVEDWLKVYTSERETRFNEMEYHLPYEEGAKALAEIIALAERHFPEVYFPMEVRSVKADDFWLSPFYQRKTCSIAIHHDAKQSPKAFFAAAEPIFRKYGGRPHWGKMHSLTATDFAAIYPRWKDAMDIRRDIDPDGRFISPYLARIFGIEA